MKDTLPIETILKQSRDINTQLVSNSSNPSFNINLFTSNMRGLYPILYSDYAPIFNISLTKAYDYTRLKYMLEMSVKVKNNELTQHDADVAIGQRLVDDIVKPQIPSNKNKK